MLLFAKAKIKVNKAGQVTVRGSWEKYRARIVQFIDELGLTGVTITLSGSNYRFSSSLDSSTRQRLRNFLINECPGSR